MVVAGKDDANNPNEDPERSQHETARLERKFEATKMK